MESEPDLSESVGLMTSTQHQSEADPLTQNDLAKAIEEIIMQQVHSSSRFLTDITQNDMFIRTLLHLPEVEGPLMVPAPEGHLKLQEIDGPLGLTTPEDPLAGFSDIPRRNIQVNEQDYL